MSAEIHVQPGREEKVAFSEGGGAWIDFGDGVVVFHDLVHARSVIRRIAERLGLALEERALAQLIAAQSIRHCLQPTRVSADLRLVSFRLRSDAETAADADLFARAADVVDEQLRVHRELAASLNGLPSTPAAHP